MGMGEPWGTFVNLQLAVEKSCPSESQHQPPRDTPLQVKLSA